MRIRSVNIVFAPEVLIVSVMILILSIGLPTAVRAETHVTDPDFILNGGHWTASSSPYILDTDLFMQHGYLLSIDPGVVIMSGTTTNSDSKWLNVNGDLSIRGTMARPVTFNGLAGFVVSDATATMAYAQFYNTKVSLYRSSSTVAHSIFEFEAAESDTGAALSVYGSQVLLSDSDFTKNSTAIHSYFLDDMPVLMKAQGKTPTLGGIGNALEAGRTPQNQIRIINSNFENNTKYTIYNELTSPVDARNNWWGNSEGPATTSLYGTVLTSPWGNAKNNLPLCCSNVLFLPGIEASRLYIDQSSVTGFGTTTNRLWEPNRNNDVRKLFLNADGSSKNSAIYTKGIIDKGIGYRIYSSFIAMMNEMVTAGKIKQWLPFAYDWRKGLDEIVDSGLLSQAVSLANSSPTGKITIVAHSNGGLLAKMLGYRLEQMGKASIIDQFIMVAVPELGTPQVIAGLLHGDNQALGKGLVLSQSVAREFGLNMIGAYGLIPSRNYFNRISDPVINVLNISTNTKSIATYTDLKEFLIGSNPKRTQPIASDTKTASVLSADILGVAERIHSWVDDWLFPTSTKVFSIAGWHMPTTKTVQYSNGSMSKLFTSLGDGTVLTHVADRYNPIYYDQLSGTKKEIVSHADILEAKSVRDIVASLIATSSASVSGVAPASTSAPMTPELPAQLPQGISRTLPPLFMDSWMILGVHSPVDIDVYDTSGGHVGIIPNPNPDSDLAMLDNTIPGAVYDTLGDEKYVIVPVTATSSYQVAFTGTGSGSFTFTLEQSVADKPLRSVTYADMPVTPLFQGSTTITSLINLVSPVIIASSTVPGGTILSFASTTPPALNLDFDGNGSVDATTTPHTSVDPLLKLESLRVLVLGMNLPTNTEKDILNRIEKVRRLIMKGDARDLARIRKIFKDERYNSRHDNHHAGRHSSPHWYFKKMTQENREELTALVRTLLDAIL